MILDLFYPGIFIVLSLVTGWICFRWGRKHGADQQLTAGEERLRELEMDHALLKHEGENRQKACQEQIAINEKLRTEQMAFREENARLTQALEDLKLQQQEREKERAHTQKEFMEAAKSSVFETAQQLSTKLLQDHKQENEITHKKSTEIAQEMHKQLKQLSERTAQIEKDSTHMAHNLGVVQKALQSPGAAGNTAETTLNNMLKNSDLREERDYRLQYGIKSQEEGRLRPDAIIFLPGDWIFVVDSKSSQYLMEMAEKEGSEEENLASENFRKSMRQHLKNLVGKEYANAVKDFQKQINNNNKGLHVKTLMYLPNDGAVEKLQRIDPAYLGDAAAKNISLVGPSGLWSAIGIAALHIRHETQQENLREIMEDTTRLIERMSVMLGHAESSRKAIAQAATNMDKMAGSINRFVLPLMKKIETKGIKSGKELPLAMKRLQVIQEDDIVDTDFAEIEDKISPPLLDDPNKT